MTDQDINALRKEVKHRMVDLDLDCPGSLQVISRRMAERTGKAVNRNSLVMALTGYRNGPASRALLEGTLSLLDEWPAGEKQSSPECMYTRGEK